MDNSGNGSLKNYIKRALISPNVVTFASKRAREFLKSEFGLTVSSLLRPFSVESCQEFIWPPSTEPRNSDSCRDTEWELRDCRESAGDFYISKDVVLNKPLVDNESIWTPKNKLEGVKIILQENEIINEQFGVKFLSLCESNCDSNNCDSPDTCNNMLNSLRSYDGFEKLFPYTEAVSNLIIGKGGKQLEYVLKDFFQLNTNQSIDDDLVTYNNNRLPFWFKRWFDAFNEEYSYLNSDSITQPIGGIIFVDLSEDDPVESIIEITNSLRTGRDFQNIGGNSNYYIYGRSEPGAGTSVKSDNYKPVPHYIQESYLCDFPFVYIFINDERSNFNFMENDQNIISGFKLSFPDSICYIWNVKGINASETLSSHYNSNENMSEKCSSDERDGLVVSPGTFFHPFKEHNSPFIGTRYFRHDELEQLNSFIIDSVKNVFVPWLQVTINRLNSYVIQARKGIKNHLRIFWRRPRNESSGSNSEGLLSTLGVGTVFNNLEERSQIFEHEISLFSSKQHPGNDIDSLNSNYDGDYYADDSIVSSLSSKDARGGGNSYLYYSSTSLEGQTRMLADLLLVSGFYQQSVHFYKQILTEYKLDKSFLHIGSTFFSISLAQILTDCDFESISNSCFNSSAYFQRNKDKFGRLLSIKPLLILVIALFDNCKHRDASFSDSDGSIGLQKSLIELLTRLSGEMQYANKKLRPRYLFSTDSYSSLNRDNPWQSGSGLSLKDTKMFSIFGVVNFSLSKIINLISNGSIYGSKIQSSVGSLYSHTLNLCIANTAQAFQRINLFGLSQQSYLALLHQIKRFSYKYIEKHFKLHSARLFREMSLFSQATIIYISLLMDIVNERIGSNGHHFGLEKVSSFEADVLYGCEVDFNGVNLINLSCYNEFINSFLVYTKKASTEADEKGDMLNGSSSSPTCQLKIPLPMLLPFGSLLIIETDSDSRSRVFGKEDRSRIQGGVGPEDGERSAVVCSPECECHRSCIVDLPVQNHFCNHKSPGKQPSIRTKNTGSSRSPGNISGDEEEFHSLVEKINSLLDSDSGLDSSEITELRSQYALKGQERDDLGLDRPKELTSSQLCASNSVRFSTIGKVCSVEFSLYNPLSFPIRCESVQLWGHLRIQDGSMGKTRVVNDSECLDKSSFSGCSGLVFFEKSVTLESNETKALRLSVLPLESGELFILGISFFLEGKIPIRQNFSTCSVYFDKLATKLDLRHMNNQNNPPLSKDNCGVQKVNVLNCPQTVSVVFGNIRESSLGVSFQDESDKSIPLYSGTRYTLPIRLLSEPGNSPSKDRDSLFLVVPSFKNKSNVDIKNNSGNYALLSEGGKNSHDCKNGFAYKLLRDKGGELSEFDLSIWVNSKCRGNVYFILLNSNKATEDYASDGGGLVNGNGNGNVIKSGCLLSQSQSSSFSRGKVNRSITFASLRFNFEDSVSASCTVIPGRDNCLNKLLLRIKNEFSEAISICDISAYPSKWLTSGTVQGEATHICNRIDLVPKTKLSVTCGNRRNGCNDNILNGKYTNFGRSSAELIHIRPSETQQLLVDLESPHATAVDGKLLSVMNVNLVLSWGPASIFRDHETTEAGTNDYSGIHSPTSPNWVWRTTCIYHVGLSDPFSTVHIEYPKLSSKTKHQPLFLSVNTNKGLAPNKGSPFARDHCPNEKAPYVIQADVSVMNTSLNSTVACTMVCCDSRPLPAETCRNYQMVPSGSSSNRCVSGAKERSKAATRILESGELNWIGSTLTHFRLDPRGIARFRLVSIVPFKGVFSTNSIKLVVREKVPFASFGNRTNQKEAASWDPSSHCDLGTLFVCYMNWHPRNATCFQRYQLKTPLDFLEHSSSVTEEMIMNTSKYIPAYIENKSRSDKLQKKSSKNGSMDVRFEGQKPLPLTNANSQEKGTAVQPATQHNNEGDSAPSPLQKEDEEKDDAPLPHLLNCWVCMDEANDAQMGSIHSASFSATHRSRKLEIDNNKKNIVVQKPFRTQYVVRF